MRLIMYPRANRFRHLEHLAVPLGNKFFVTRKIMHSRKVVSIRGWKETHASHSGGEFRSVHQEQIPAAEAGAGLWIFEWNLATRRCREKLSVEDAEQLWIIHVTVSSLCFRCFRSNFIFRAGIAPTSACTEFNVDPRSSPRWHVARGFKVPELPPPCISHSSSSRCLSKWDTYFDAESKRCWQVSIASALVFELDDMPFHIITRENTIKDVNVREFFDCPEK